MSGQLGCVLLRLLGSWAVLPLQRCHTAYDHLPAVMLVLLYPQRASIRRELQDAVAV